LGSASDRLVGVATSQVDRNSYLGACPNGWGLWNDSLGGHSFHDNIAIPLEAMDDGNVASSLILIERI
jgi:hypothetical protein